MNRKILKNLAVPIIASVVATLMIGTYSLRRELRLRARENLTSVVIANHYIRANSIINKKDLAVVKQPKAFIPEGSYIKIDSANGSVALSDIHAGEIVTKGRIAPISELDVLSANLRPGERAVSVGVDLVSGAGMFINPGDKIDLLSEFKVMGAIHPDSQVFTILQDIEVLAVNKNTLLKKISEEGTRKNNSPTMNVLTLRVTPHQAQSLVFAQINGEVVASLRSRGEHGASVGLSPASAATVTGVPTLIPKREYRGR